MEDSKILKDLTYEIGLILRDKSLTPIEKNNLIYLKINKYL